MSVEFYDKGDQIRFSATFKNLSGATADPTTIVFKAKKPAGTITTYTFGAGAEIVKDGTGVYHIDLDIDASGDWSGRWEGTGAVKVAEEFTFIGRESAFP